MPAIGVIADDLTGATTTGVLLARSKARTAVFFNEKAAEKADDSDKLHAVIISSNSRPLAAETAYNKVVSATNALKRMGAVYFSKRIDTTLRGGIGVEIDAMLDELDEDTVAVVVPAMPQSRRILVGGYSVIDGVALVNTPVAHDVRTPVTENYIPALLKGQSKRTVGFVGLNVVLAGGKTLESALRDERVNGAQIIVADAISIEDVEALAKACINLKWKVLAVDPGPFTAKLAYCRGLIETEQDNIPDNDGAKDKTVLIAAGSATPVTKKQMYVLCKDEKVYRISVNPESLIDEETAEREVSRAVEEATVAIRSADQPKAVLFETALHGNLLCLADEDKKFGLEPGMSADRINSGLGRIITGVLEKCGRNKIAGIYTTGGDTMVNVCSQLGVHCIEVVDYVIPQTDIGRLVGKYDGLPIVGKGGLTGHETIVCEIVERLLKEALRER